MQIKPLRKSYWLFVSSLALWLLFFNAFFTLAQTDIPIPIAIGESKVGEIVEADQVLTFALPVGQPQVLEIAVFAITPGLTPSFQVFNQARTLIAEVINTGSEPTVLSRAISVSDGFFLIDVFGEDSSLGQFLITVQPGTPLEPPQPIGIGQVITDSISSAEPRHTYQFVSPESTTLLLTIFSVDPTQPLEITLKDANTDEILAHSNTRISRVSYLIIPGLADYTLEVAASEAGGPQGYTLCLDDEQSDSICATSGQGESQSVATPASLEPTSTPIPLATLPTTGACIVASASGGTVNIRSGPGTSYTVMGQISGNSTAPVVGRLSDSSWYQINPNGLIGWISASVVRLGGVCNTVPALTLTPTATSAGASATPTGTLTQTAETPTPTWTPTATPTATPTPAAVPTLNFSLSPVYGSTSLSSGFVPDPYTVGVTGGGPVNVAYLGGGCSGFTTSAPSFSVNYTAGAFPTLRFYFIGSGDSTMIINTPGGSYFCVDDSFGTLNPTIDFNTPSSGRYDIWIGSYASGSSVGGTLYVTENTANHP